jgi:hypothetical protein
MDRISILRIHNLRGVEHMKVEEQKIFRQWSAHKRNMAKAIQGGFSAIKDRSEV